MTQFDYDRDTYVACTHCYTDDTVTRAVSVVSFGDDRLTALGLGHTGRRPLCLTHLHHELVLDPAVRTARIETPTQAVLDNASGYGCGYADVLLVLPNGRVIETGLAAPKWADGVATKWPVLFHITAGAESWVYTNDPDAYLGQVAELASV